MAETTAAPTGFLQYEEPDIVQILVLISFFFLLSLLRWVFDKLIRAGLTGQILLGILYGVPVGKILSLEWQDTFLALGYIGLILIVFEGGLTIRLDLLKANVFLSLVATAIGIVAPIVCCYLLLYLGFGYSAMETFIVAAALSTTSLGTTFVVLNSSKNVEIIQSKVGTVLISAALFDDITGLIMVSIISSLGTISDHGSVNIGWIAGRPILASVAVGAISPLLSAYAARPLYRRWVEPRIVRLGHKATICMMVLILSAHLVICAYTGASLLFGAFLSGTFLSMLPTCPGHTETENGESEGAPAFHQTFEKYVSSPQKFFLEPLFFASIGFAIPFTKLWTGAVIWRGVVFSILMVFSKAAVGLCVPLWDVLSECKGSKEKVAPKHRLLALRRLVASHWAPATFLGMSMVARGEIGLLIIQIGLNETSFLSEEAFLVAIWSIILNTIIGPLSVGLLLRKFDRTIADSARWGLQASPSEARPSPVSEAVLRSSSDGLPTTSKR